jgi:hypothetical protein
MKKFKIVVQPVRLLNDMDTHENDCKDVNAQVAEGWDVTNIFQINNFGVAFVMEKGSKMDGDF